MPRELFQKKTTSKQEKLNEILDKNIITQRNKSYIII